MGTFNFSNMQGGQQQETQNIPREFRPAVEQAKTEPVGSYGNNKTGFWDGVKNFFSGADVDTSAGFIDETGTWNNGTKQELAKYYPTQKSAEELEKDRLGSLWDRTYKKYHYSKDDVLLEAKKISVVTNIPENAILANADNLANARNVYNYQQKAMDPQAVFKAYPELSELAKLSDTDAAIALHNLKNVRQTQGIIEAAKTGWELDNLMSERGRMGYAAMNGKELTDADIARLGEIEKAQKNSKELPGLFEDPMSAIVGGTVQSGKMMLRNALNGQKMGVYGAGFGALLGGIAGGGATLGAGTAAGAAAGAKIGYSVGSRIGMAQDMYDEIAGNNYLDYRGYKDKQGRQLLTDNQARSYAAVAAALETGIEFANADKILNVIKGGAGAQSIKEIISSAKDSTELQSLLAAYLRDSAKNIGTVAISESAEEGVQEMSNRIISDIAAANNPGGDIPTYTAKDVIVGGLEASWQALPASIGFGAGAHGASTVSFMRRASAALQLKSEEQKANLRDANGISMLRSLAEDIKNNALFKKAPEVYNEVLNNQLKGTELETINIDTEYVLNQQGGYELLKSAAKAAGIGEQYLKDIIDTKADLKISTADYVSKLLPTEIGAHLEDYITFSDISECLARNREYAGRMRREMDRILAYENRQREDALNTYLDNNFHTPETREIAEAVLRRFPDNPKEGVKEIRKSLQAKIDEPLNQIIEELEKGMGNGVAVVEIPEYDNQMRGRGIKVSNNDPWYQRYYKENKHKPSKMELRELAREIWTGHNEYGLFGWENRTPEDNQWYENNKASMEATEEAIRRLDALTPALEEIDPGELSITEGLSEEGFEVYRKLRGKLEGAESKEVRQAAQMSAILAARMADRMAELHRQVGHTKYTALDYARSIGLIRSESEAVEQKFNQAAMHKENKRYVLNEDGNVDWGNVNELVADDGTTIKKAPVRMQIGYQVGAGDAGAGYIHIKNRHTGFIEGKGYKNVSDIVYDVLENADFAVKSISADGRERIALIKDLTPHTSILLALDYTEEDNDSYYTIVSIMPQSKKQTKEAKEKALSFDGSVRPSPATGSGAFFTPTETKAGIEGGSFAGKDNAFDTVSLSDAEQYVNEYTYEQKRLEATPHIGTDLTVQRPTQEVIDAYNELEAMKPATLEFAELYGLDLQEQRKVARKKFNELYKENGDSIYITNRYGNEINVPTAIFKEIKGHTANVDLLSVIPHIQELLDTCVYLYTSMPDASREKRMMRHVVEYRTYGGKIIVSGNSYYVKVVVRLQKNGDFVLHDVDISGKKIKDETSIRGDSRYKQEPGITSSSFVTNSIPWWLNEVKTKLILVNKIQQNDNTLDQKAWHGTPYDFERFDIGKIGDGVGDQVHGWGLYFAKDRKISEAYKEVLGAAAGALIVDGVTYKIDEEGDWATAAGQKLIDNDPLEFVLDTFDAMSGSKNQESAIKSLKERIAGTKRTANTESYIAKLEEAINIIEKADVKYENTSRLLKVEVPENNVLLDEQKTFINQNKNVQALLKNTIESLDDARSMKFWENLLDFKLRAFDNAGKVQFKIDGFNKLADGIGKLLESKSNTFGYRTLARSLERYGYSKEEIEKLKSDGEYRNQEQQKLRSQAAALEEELERAKAEDSAAKEEVINQAKADISGTLGGMFSGNKIYDALAKAMGEEDYNWRGASELLNEHGIKGIAYEGMKDGRCFVVFDDKAVDIIERYNQSAGERAMTANMEKLKEAKEMLAKDADMKTIYQKTGWHRGADGKWRFEIPDNLDDINLAELRDNEETTLGKIYDNPALYQAYPWLKNLLVTVEDMEKNRRGYAYGEEKIVLNEKYVGYSPYNLQNEILSSLKSEAGVTETINAFQGIVQEEKLPGKEEIRTIAENLPDSFFADREEVNFFAEDGSFILPDDEEKTYSLEEKETLLAGHLKEALEGMRPNEKIKETLIHEIQHIIQNAEGFAGGGSPAKVNEQMKRQLQKYDEEIERLHPKGKEYVTSMLEYDIADFEHDTGEISDETFADIKNKVKELAEQIPEEKVKRLKEVKELQMDLQWQAEDESFSDYEKYLRLHGEKEARVASMKARLYTMGASQERIDNEVLNAIDNPIIVFGGRSYSMDSDQRGLWQLKGQTAFKTTGEKVISLFKAADQSTFMHEMAHIYLHDMLALAELPNAPKQLLDDVATINRWAAWNDTQFVKEYKGTAMESEFKKLNEQMKTAVAKGSVEIEGKKMTLEQMQRLWMQERFARGFENYLKSGDAPTEATRSIFRRFKQWLTKIYRAFSQIGGAPSKEVKAVMDRMIASEDEIDIAMRKKGVDDFAESGGMDYLEGSTKDVYRRMVERAKADAEEKVLKIALKDVKEDYRQQEKELFEREEAEYRDKLAAEPVFIIREHIKNNPDMSTSVICETLGMNVEDYVKQLKEYGGSLDAAVKAHMKEFKEGIDNSGIDAQYFRERAEEVVQESKYRKLATAMELEAFERIAKKQRNLTTQIEADGKNDAAEKGVIKTVDKMTRQSKQIEELTAETKGLKQDKRELLANVRGLRDAALSHYKDYVQFVEMKLEVMPIEDANNYQMWRRKSAQAQYNSEQSLIKGNWDKAVKYKQAQLIYDMFADRAVRNAKQIKKIEDGLKRKQQTISKAKNISADERYAYNHLMYVFGFSDADAPVPPHYEGIMEVLMKADATREEGGLMLESPFFGPDGQTNLPEWFLQAAMNSNKRKAGHKDLSNMQVDLVAQVMHIIYKRGMDNMKLATIKTKDGRTLTVDEAVAEIEGQTRQRMIELANADPTGANKNRWQDDAANFIDQADRVLIKPEVELKKLGDVALRYIYDPLKEAADKELKMAVNMQNKLKGLFDAYSPEELADMRNKRLYDFGSSKITKEQAIMIALNWGTETNQQRVLDGYHVNVAQVKNVLQYLDERDWNLVNSIWKLYDIHWDQIREIEARMTGAVLQKQEAKGFVVVGQDRKIYTLDGGYFPIKYDLRDLRTQEQADAAQQSAMSNIAMSMGKGFLKERTQHKVERRLDLRFEVISGSITDVIHLVAFREPVRDVRRIVLNENFKNLVYNYLGQNAYKNLKKWTSDCWAEEPIPRTAYEKGMAKLRNAQTMGTMGFRVTTALLNIANAPSVAHYMGAAELLHSLKKFYSAPRRYTDFVFQRSVFMAERAETMDASIHDALKGPNILDGIPGIGKAGEAIKNNAFKMITWTDLMLALPLWQHEYEKTYNAEVDAGRSPQQAREAGVNAGDAAVRWCFGSGRTVDKAAIQRKGSELMKQLTMYYSYNSTVYNALNYKLWEAKVGYKKAVAASAKNKSIALMKAVAHAGDALLMWILLPALISALLRAGASGDDDDWKIEKLIKSMGQESLTGIVGGIPVLRDAVPYFMAKVFDEHQFAPKIPIQNTIEQTNRVIQSAVSDKKTISDTLREMGKLTSQVTGAPSTLIDSFTTTLQYLESGFDESVADYLRALIFDKKLKKNQK